MSRNPIDSAVVPLKNTSIFRSAGAEELKKQLRAGGQIAVFKRGEKISFRENRPAIGLLLSGKATVEKGRAVISTLEAGAVFGAVGLFCPREHPATEITAATECRVVFLSKELVVGMMAENSAIAENYIEYLSERIYFLTDKIEGYTAGSAGSKLANYLLSNKTPENGVVTADLGNLSQLARELDIGRASLYRELEFFIAQGALERNEKKVRITDESFLARSANRLQGDI